MYSTITRFTEIPSVDDSWSTGWLSQVSDEKEGTETGAKEEPTVESSSRHTLVRKQVIH